MQKIPLILSSLLLALATHPIAIAIEQTAIATNKSQSSANIVDRVDRIAQQITVRIDSTQSGNGSGVIIAKDGNTYSVLTAAHVVKNQDRYTIVAPDGQQYPITTTIVLEGADLAVIKFTSDRAYSLATLANYDLRDRWVFVAGFSKSQEKNSRWLLTSGQLIKTEVVDFVAKESYSLMNGYELVYSNLSYRGMSGGAVLDSRGYVIGINAAAENEIEIDGEGQTEEISLGYSLGIPIRTFLGLTNKTKISRSQLQLETSAPPTLTPSQIDAIAQTLLTSEEPSLQADAFDWLNWGNQLWRFDRIEESIAAYDKAIALKPDFYQAYYAKGISLLAADKDGEALTAFSKATELATNFYPAWRRKGMSLHVLGKLPEALTAYDRAIQINPNDFVLQVERGHVLLTIGRYQDAIIAANAALTSEPHAHAYNLRGIAYAMLKQYQKAIADYSQALILDPNNDAAYNNRAISLTYLQQYQQAIADYSKALELNPKLVGVYFNRGIAYGKIQQHSNALADYTKAIELQPNFAEAYYNRGNIYLDLQEDRKALADFTKAIELQPNLPAIYIDRGVTYARLQQHQKAIADYTKAIELQPQTSLETIAYYSRGNSYLDLQDYQNAIADLDRAIQLQSDFAAAYYSRGLTYLELQEEQKAIADLEKAESIFCQAKDPNCERVRQTIIENRSSQ